jgi:hypothetical protein
MVALNKNATDLSNNDMVNHEIETLKDVTMHASTPVFICGVNRRLNVGNYEHVDIYAGVTVPLMGVLPEDVETFKKAIQDAAELAFGLASQETGKRYHELKDMQKGGRPTR